MDFIRGVQVSTTPASPARGDGGVQDSRAAVSNEQRAQHRTGLLPRESTSDTPSSSSFEFLALQGCAFGSIAVGDDGVARTTV